MAGSRARATGPAERFFQFSVLGLVASGYLAVVGSGYLDVPTAAVAGAALVIRFLMAAGVLHFEFPDRFFDLLALAYIAFYAADYLWISREFLTATVHLIFFLAVIKVLTARTPRDYFFVKIIAFMELLAAAVLSNSLNFFIFLALFLFCGVCTFAASEIRRSALLPRRVSRAGAAKLEWRLTGMTISTAAGILVLTGGLFFLLPRTARAAFRHFASQHYRMAGFSDQVELGALGELRKTDTPVMRVRVDGMDSSMFKWRGAALTHFDGHMWSNDPQLGQPLKVQETLLRLADNQQQWRKGARISYEVALQSTGSDVLFFAGVPEFVRVAVPVVYRLPNDTYRTDPGFADGVRYYAYSYIPDERSPANFDAGVLPEALRRSYLQLPSIDPRIPELTRSIAHNAPTDYDAAQLVENHLRTQYAYSTELLEAPVPDPLAYFLFDRKKGHCEYFASAMAVMLRSMGIPARVVTGFQSGVYNPMTGWQVIRTSDAHSWVEAYLQKRGWTTFDPTPPDSQKRSTGFLARVSMMLDAADTFWQEWVLNYNRDRQFDLALKIDSSSRSMRVGWFERAQLRFRKAGREVMADVSAYGPGLAIFIAAALLSWVAWPTLRDLLRSRRQKSRLARGEVSPHDATVLYQRLLTVMRKRGYEKPSWLTPAEFAVGLPASADLGTVEDLTDAYHRLRYGGDRAAASRMMALLERIEHPGARR